MLWNDSHTGYSINIGHMKGLHLAVILDVPHVDHTFGITRDKALQTFGAVHTHERGFMTVKFNDVVFPVRVPYEYLEIKTYTHQNLVVRGVRDLPDCPLVSDEFLCSFLGDIISNVNSVAFI